MENAILSLTTALVSPILTLFGNKATSFFGGDITTKELDELKTTILPKINAVIKVADTINVEELMPWLMKLKVAAYEAEDVIDEYDYVNIENNVSHLPTSLKKFKGKAKEFFGPVLLKTSLKRSMEKLRQSADETDKFVPLLGVISRIDAQQNNENQQRTTIPDLMSPVFGKDEELNSLLSLLVDGSGASTSNNNYNNIPVHAICGVGGAGKTTLAQYFYNCERVKTFFELKIWVHVSHNFNAGKITKDIIKFITGSLSTLDGDLVVLQSEAKKLLKSKKFLLVLDDIWCEDREKWDQFLIPLIQVGNSESMILITTRTERVASMLGLNSVVPLKELKTEDCWSIVKHYAFGEANIEDPALHQVGLQIVHKLKHSPLAARIIGCSLKDKVDVNYWKILLKDDMLKDTKNTLVLSFQHLPSHLKRCFSFCSIFPKGFHFDDVDDLVRLWIAQGFVEVSDNNESTLEELGRQYFNDLLSYSFFQIHETYRVGNCVYVIHDLLHDLAEEVSKDTCFRIECDGPFTIPESIMHLSVSTNNFMDIPDIFKLKNLRTFIKLFFAFDDHEIKKVNKIFKNLKKLRVLDFGNCSISEFHNSVRKLKHLRYLKAMSVNKLAKSFCRLYHLQFLHLYCNMIGEVPESFNNLINLRYTSSDYESILGKVPNIGNLISLQALDVYCPNANAEFGMGQLKNMNQLHGALEIVDLQNVKDGAEAATAKLKDKRNLVKLYLSWSTSGNEQRKSRDENVFEGLEPPPNVELLKIDGYQGTKLPDWWIINHQCCLSNLKFLELVNCPNLTEVPSLPNHLQNLCIILCQNLIAVTSLPNGLYTLEVRGCPRLKDLPSLPCSLAEIQFHECAIETLLWSPSYYDDNNSNNNENENDNVKERGQHQPRLILSCPPKVLTIRNCSCVEDKALHAFFHESLSQLIVKGLPLITCLRMGSNFTALKALTVEGCGNLLYLEGIGYLHLLEELYIGYCPELSSLGSLQPLPSLKWITVRGCLKLTTVGGAGAEKDYRRLLAFKGELYIDEPLLLPVLLEEEGLISLKNLTIATSLDTAFSVRQEEMFLLLTSLSHLSFHSCENLLCLPGNLEEVSSLQKLELIFCGKMESLPNLPTSLQSLEISGCDMMESLPNPPTSLQSLSIKFCSKMESLPDLPASLLSLDILECHPQMQKNYGVGGSLHHRIAHIPSIVIF